MNAIIKQESIAEQVAEKIRKAILDGELAAGSKVTEHDICNQLNVSRTPVREAFRILQAEGYLTYKPRFGVFVTKLSLQDVYDIWEVRILVEEEIARKSSKFIGEYEKKLIYKELSRIADLQSCSHITAEKFNDIDEQYYDIHVSNCRNKKMEETARYLKIGTELMRRLAGFSERRAREALEEIKAMYEAYLLNDEEKAVECNRKHFYGTLKEIENSINAG